MARNLITPRRAEITGLRELEIKLGDFLTGVTAKERTKLAQEVMDALGETARENIADVARTNAKNQGVPQQVIDSIFTDQRMSGIRRNRPSVLVGVNKRRTMVQWTAGRNPKSPRAKVSPGGKVAMSLASMFEFGTSRMRPRPFMRPALAMARATVVAKLGDKLKDVIERWARR